MAKGQLSSVFQRLRQIIDRSGTDDLTDGELLRRFAAQRDEAVFAAILERHGPMVLGVCRRILSRAHDIEDAFQATFLVLIRKARTLRQPELLSNWLHGVAYRTALMAKSTTARRRRLETQQALSRAREMSSDATWNELRPVLDAELLRLPDKYRLPLILCYLEGRSRSEAAKRLGWPEGTVAGRLARARELLRSRLVRRGLTVSAGVLTAALAREVASAAVPGPLMLSTLQTATRLAADAAVVPVSISTLAEGVLRSMLLTKLKLAAVLLVTLGLLGAGGALTYNALASDAAMSHVDRDQDKPAATKPPAASADPSKPTAEERWAEQAVFDNQRGGVLQVTFDPMGKLLACAGGDGVIRLWNVKTQREQAALKGHDAPVRTLAFSADGKSLVSMSHRGTLKTWDVAKAKESASIEITEGMDVRAVALSADGTTLVTSVANLDPGQKNLGPIQVWDTATGKRRKTLPGHSLPTDELYLSPDGKILVSSGGGQDKPARPGGAFVDTSMGQVKIWDVAKDKLLHTFPDQSPTRLALSADGKTLAVAGPDASGQSRQVKIIEVSTGKERSKISLRQTDGGVPDRAVRRRQDARRGAGRGSPAHDETGDPDCSLGRGHRQATGGA